MHNLAVAADGSVYSWGNGENGQLGHGDEEHQSAPKHVAALQGVRVCSVAAGNAHSLSAAADGSLWGWGNGEDCTLGLQPVGRHRLLPERFPGLRI